MLCSNPAALAFPLCRELLDSLTLGRYLATRPPRAVISITAADTVGSMLRRFACAGLVAAPLFEDEQRTQYRGFVDLLDIVAAVVAAAHQPATPTAGSAHALRARAPAAARLVATQPVGSIRAMDNDAQLVFQAQLGNSLLEVVREGFAHPVDQLKCHRLAVFRPASSGAADMECLDGSSADLAAIADLQFTDIISQSDALRFLHKHQAQLGEALLHATLEQLGITEKPCMCAAADASVIDCLAGMVDSRVPALAVIDSYDRGQLLGCLSISDLRGILPEHFEQMSEPVGDFLRGGGWRGSPRWQPSSPRLGVAAEFGIRSPETLPRAPSLAFCTLQSRFGDVLDLLVTRHLHRVFICDADMRPAGVLSCTDILRLVAGPVD
ncbi:hypothetical protein COHA_001050 [Chlorella ohadii]|uniref:CBS domain-containing protein n=1 Tax=Chlorella ohadii TaxID=2649997 RepID=A0AAD5H8K2_9CHLO|nr:hypothetical protein COHA_001050 [Chlorella ohadii]